MNFSLKIKSTVSIIMLAAVSMLLFGLTTFKAQAQNTTPSQTATKTICFLTTATTNNLVKLSGNTSCPSGWSTYNPPSNDQGLCITDAVPIKVISPSEAGIAILTNGTECGKDSGESQPNGEPIYDYVGKYIPFSSIQVYTPPGTGGGPNPAPPKPTPTPTPTPGTTPPTPVSGGCDPGFHKTGPICVPNSPFSTGIAGDPSTQTASGLAVRIIKILLYFAGIVAVIMAIIGGYQIMTAAGNATQAANGRKTLTNAIIGLVIVILAYVIIQAVIAFITK